MLYIPCWYFYDVLMKHSVKIHKTSMNVLLIIDTTYLWNLKVLIFFFWDSHPVWFWKVGNYCSNIEFYGFNKKCMDGKYCFLTKITRLYLDFISHFCCLVFLYCGVFRIKNINFFVGLFNFGTAYWQPIQKNEKRILSEILNLNCLC